MSPATDIVTVAVETGLHAGVEQSLPPGRIVIGSDLTVDIVLHDDGVEPFHLAVEVEQGQVRLEALADGVEIDEVGTLSLGASCHVPLPFMVRLGSAALRWSAIEVEAPIVEAPPSFFDRLRPLKAFMPSRAALGGAVAVMLCGALVITNQVADAAFRTNAGPTGASASDGPSREVTGKSTTLPERVTVPGSGPSPVKAASGTEDALAPVREEIQKAGLFNITVSAGGGVITATGTVQPEATRRWQSVQQWFDERFAGELTLVNAVTVKAEKLPSSIAIEAVWRGAAPYLIVRGQKYAQGSALEGGWIIEQIEAERVLLKRDGRIVAVRY